MKKSHIPITLLAATFVLSGITSQAAPLNPTLSFHENGQGLVELPNGVVIPLLGVLAPDPGPGGLSSALTFTAHPGEELFVVGDVIVLDANGNISDVFRFNPGTGSPGGFSQGLVFYSNDQAGLLADMGLPSSFYANAVRIFESSTGPTSYIPTAGQPGFEAGLAVPITYQIFSVADTGSTLSFLIATVLGVALLRLIVDSGESNLGS
jgi:hypothetical protein